MNNNVLAVGTNLAVLAGKCGVYCTSVAQFSQRLIEYSGWDTLTNDEKEEVIIVNFANADTKDALNSMNTPTSDCWLSVIPPEESSVRVECIAISKDDSLIAVGDSLHSLSVYQNPTISSSPAITKWTQVYNSNTGKRIIIIKFTPDGRFLTVLDKQGDIFVIAISGDHSNRQYSKLKKILGHTSFISDYIPCINTKQIVSCDRDEKIRISKFPEAYVIQGFKLGHEESVTSVAILEFQENRSTLPKSAPRRYLLSISVAGVLVLWNFDEFTTGTDVEYVKLWNMQQVICYEHALDVKTMKACVVGNEIIVSIAFSTQKTIYICGVSMSTLSIRLIKEIKTDSELNIMEWIAIPFDKDAVLVVYTPQFCSMQWWQRSTNAINKDFSGFSENTIQDIKDLAATYKSAEVPMKKRLTNEDILLQLNRETKIAKADKA